LNTGLILVILTCVVALAFDFINGFHDAANSIATVVSTRVLSPKLAVVWAAFFNFRRRLPAGHRGGKTIGKGMVDLSIVTQYVVLAGLLGAIAWDLLTWWLGLPTSSSHALIGGYAGAAIARAGILHGWRTSLSVIIPGGWTKTIIFIFVAPVMGFVLGFTFMVAVYWIFQNKAPRQVDTWFRKLQLLSAAAYSLGTGAMTRKRPWASSPGRSSPGTSSPSTTSNMTGATTTGRSSCAPTPQSPPEPTSADGGLSTPWAARSQSLSRWGASAPRLPGPSHCSVPPRRNSRLHHAHDHRSDHRCRHHAASIRRSLGGGHPHRLGLGADHSRFGRRRRRDLLPHAHDQSGGIAFFADYFGSMSRRNS
jgi:hypothetical protein